MKYRICYAKNRELIFISHLDLQKVFQRAFRRAKVDLAFSQGFHPHPKMTYSPPLPLFASSDEEYLDVELNTVLSADEIKNRLCATLPDGLLVKDVKELTDAAPGLSSILYAAEYEIVLQAKDGEDNRLCETIQTYFTQSNEIMLRKKNKKNKIVQKDLKPGIYAFSCNQVDDTAVIDCTLSIENDTLVNPFSLLQAFRENIPQLEDINPISVRKLCVIKSEEQKT